MTKQNMLKASKLDFHICIIFLGSQVNFVKINRSFTLTLSKLMKIFFSFCIGIHEKFDREKMHFCNTQIIFCGLSK